MANFTQSFKLLLQSEGDYVNDPQDPGGETYKGIARKMNPKWEGWKTIDAQKKKKNFPKNLSALKELDAAIEAFYKTNYWDKVKGDDIQEQEIAHSIFDFAVNAGISTSSKLAQAVVKAKADGVIGKNTLKAINAAEPEKFLSMFTVAKISRYISIIEKTPTSKKFLYGWIRRALGKN
jgi:lysozyme family protein